MSARKLRLIISVVSLLLIAHTASAQSAFTIVEGWRTGMMTVMKYFMLLGALIATVFVAVDVMKGERDSVSKLGLLILGLGLGFIAVSVLSGSSYSSEDSLAAVSAAIEKDAASSGSANWGKEYADAMDNVDSSSFTGLIGHVLQSLLATISIIFCGILSVKVMQGERDSLRKMLTTILVCAISCGVLEAFI